MKSSILLAQLPGTTANQQLLVCLEQAADGTSRIALRHQQWAEGIGWYDQKVLHLDARQWSALGRLVHGGGHRAVELEPPAVVPFSAAHGEDTRRLRLADGA